MADVMNTVKSSFGSYNYLIIYIICVIIGLVIGKEKRKQLFLPAILITIAILNPVLYKIVDRADPGHVYWRTFWMIPIIPVCAVIPGILVESIERKAVKSAGIAISIAILITFGSNDNSLRFKKWENADKLPYNVVKVAEELLQLDDEPRVVSDAGLSVYLRQYSGRIKAPYSRSVAYGEPSELGGKIFSCLYNNNMSELAALMINNGYDYLVTNNRDEEKRTMIEDAGFIQMGQVNKYGIYEISGRRNESPP